MSQSVAPVKKCKRPGCLKPYDQNQNTDQSCKYHSGKPIFHDTKKGWQCCQKIVYDWDQFQKIVGCSTGRHTDIKPQTDDGQNQFFKSSTVTNAANAIEKSDKQKIVIKDINQYNKVIDDEKKKKQEEKAKCDKQLFITKKGNLKCINQGCGKQFKEVDNHEDACQFHKGTPVFHDCKKYWTCCGGQTMDWDDFMKLPKCCKGFHSPKYKQ